MKSSEMYKDNIFLLYIASPNSEVQRNPCKLNRDPAIRTVMKTVFFLIGFKNL